MKKKDGFTNETLIVIPPEIADSADDLSRELYFTDIGHFPCAEEHLVHRPDGSYSWIFIYCRNGRGWVKQDNIIKEMGHDEAVLLEPGKTHSYGSGDKGWWEIYWFHFTGKHAGEMSRRLSTSKPGIPWALHAGQESLQLFSLICSSLASGISPYSYELACSRFRHLAGSLKADRQSGSYNSQGLITEITAFMESRVNSTMSLKEMSRQAGLAPTYFCRIFKQVTGHSPLEHFNRLKVQKACTLLDMTEERITDIAGQVGIEDPYYFSRLFRKVMGVSPRDYRGRQK